MTKKRNTKSKVEAILAARSARVITGRKAIVEHLTSRDATLELTGTEVGKGPEGESVLRKQVSLLADPSTIPSTDELRAMAEMRGVEWREGFEERVVPFWASDERVDRDGDIVEQTWNFGNFEKNPIILFGHDWFMPPIGTTLAFGVKQRTESDYNGPALHTLGLFAPEDVNAFGDTIFRMIKSGFMRTVSVGFFPGEVIHVEDDDERAKLGLGRFGVVLRNNELVEFSPVSVPANPGAHAILQAAKSAGQVRAEDFPAIAELQRRYFFDRGDEQGWKGFHGSLATVWRMLFPNVTIASHKDVDEPVQPDEVDASEVVPVTDDVPVEEPKEAEGDDAPETEGTDTPECDCPEGECTCDRETEPDEDDEAAEGAGDEGGDDVESEEESADEDKTTIADLLKIVRSQSDQISTLQATVDDLIEVVENRNAIEQIDAAVTPDEGEDALSVILSAGDSISRALKKG